MSDGITLLQQCVRPGQSGTPRQFHWGDLFDAMAEIAASPLTPQAERLLVEIIRSNHQVDVAVSPDGPHSMPPEDMLKSLAVQALVKWTGSAYSLEFRRLQAKPISPVLESVIKAIRRRLSSSTAANIRLDRIKLPMPQRRASASGEAESPGTLVTSRRFGEIDSGRRNQTNEFFRFGGLTCDLSSRQSGRTHQKTACFPGILEANAERSPSF